MGKRPRYTEIDGFALPPTFVPELFYSSMKYKPGKGDVVVATYPKCGTTWTIQIVVTMLRKGKPCNAATEYFASTPFLEMTGEQGMEHVMRPCCIKTHLPFNRINFSTEAKYIYVARQPTDCVVSFYHHTRLFPIYFFSDGEFDDYFDAFIKGEVDFGDYFAHLISWYNHKDEPNILFLTYESMKADTRNAILKIAHFLGEDYYENLLADDEKMLKDILHFSSMDYMKSTVDKFWKEVFLESSPSEEYQEQNAVARKYAQLMKEATEAGHKSIGNFVRKGKVGDGKIVLSEEQQERMKEYIREKTADNPDVLNIWENSLI